MYKKSVFLGALVFLSGVQLVDAAAARDNNQLALRHRLVGHTATICSLLYRKGRTVCDGQNENGKKMPDYLISGSQDGTIMLWNLATQQQVGLLPAAHDGAVTHLTHLQSGDFASSGADGFVRTWDFDSGRCWAERQLAAPAAGIVGWPNGQLLIAENTGKYALHFVYDKGLPEIDLSLKQVDRDIKPLLREEPSLKQNLGLVCKLMEDRQRAVKWQHRLLLPFCRKELKALRADDYAQGVMFAPDNVLARDAETKAVRWYAREALAEHPHTLLQEFSGYENDDLAMEIGSENCLFLASPDNEIHVWAASDALIKKRELQAKELQAQQFQYEASMMGASSAEAFAMFAYHALALAQQQEMEAEAKEDGGEEASAQEVKQEPPMLRGSGKFHKVPNWMESCSIS